MENKIPKEYISRISKASTYFIFKNGPIKELEKDGKIKAEDILKIQEYMQNHLAYLYTVLLEDNNLKKFELIVNTMDKFYINDETEIQLDDDGFEKFYNQLFPQINNIKFEK